MTDMLDLKASEEFRANLVGAAHKSLMASLAYVPGKSIRVMVEDLHVIAGFNPRIDSAKLRAHIRGLANKIKANGFYDHKPLSVYGQLVGKKPTLIVHDGHCRLAAVKLAISEGAQIEDLPVVIQDRSSTEEDLLVGMVNSNDGEPLTALERAIVCKRLMNFGWSKLKIADAIDKTEDYVDKLLILSGAPFEIREMVENGQVSAALATQTVVRHGGDAVRILREQLARAKAMGLTKILPRNMPGKARSRAITVAAPRMLDALTEVMKHKNALPPELRAVVEALLKEVPESDEPVGQAATQEMSAADRAEKAFHDRQLSLVS